MDVAVLIAFPCVFLIFNIVYWAAFHLWGQKFTKTAIVEGCGVLTSLSHTLRYAACCWAAFSSYSHNGLVFCIGIKNQAEATIFFLTFPSESQLFFFPIWFCIVKMYQIWETSTNKSKKALCFKMVLTFQCSNKIFKWSQKVFPTKFAFSLEFKRILKCRIHRPK